MSRNSILLLSILFMAVHANSVDIVRTELDNFSPKEIATSILKLDKSLSITFRRGSSYSQGHSHTILFASWGAPSLGHCCQQELYEAMTDGSDKQPVLIDNKIAWRVVYASSGRADLKVVQCWQMNATNTELVKAKNCPKPTHPSFKKAK